MRTKPLYNAIMAFAAGAVVLAFLCRGLVPLMLTSAPSSRPYIFLLFLALLFLSELVHRFYDIRNLLGICILRVPIEELLLAATGGAIWGMAYESVQG
jgi:hypothetical protein